MTVVTSTKDETKKLTRSNFSSTFKYLSKQNILPALCIFCRSKRKKYKQKWIELGSCLTYVVEIDIRQAAKYSNQELMKKIGNCIFGGWSRFHSNGSQVASEYQHQNTF